MNFSLKAKHLLVCLGKALRAHAPVIRVEWTWRLALTLVFAIAIAWPSVGQVERRPGEKPPPIEPKPTNNFDSLKREG
ncbi:MAG: hypothetical protein ACK5YT_16820, partial [Bacteroidota bacterium]